MEERGVDGRKRSRWVEWCKLLGSSAIDREWCRVAETIREWGKVVRSVVMRKRQSSGNRRGTEHEKRCVHAVSSKKPNEKAVIIQL